MASRERALQKEGGRSRPFGGGKKTPKWASRAYGMQAGEKKTRTLGNTEPPPTRPMRRLLGGGDAAPPADPAAAPTKNGQTTQDRQRREDCRSRSSPHLADEVDGIDAPAFRKKLTRMEVADMCDRSPPAAPPTRPRHRPSEGFGTRARANPPRRARRGGGHAGMVEGAIPRAVARALPPPPPSAVPSFDADRHVARCSAWLGSALASRRLTSSPSP